MVITDSKSQFQSPRISFIWVTVAQILCTIPHFFYIPLWVTGLCIWCLFWRCMVYQGRWSYPNRYARYALVILSIFGLMIYFPRMLTVQTALILLIITYYLKLLEMFRLKDVYVILILSYFVIASAFLLSENIIMSIYCVVSFLFTTIALVSSNRTESKLQSGGNVKQGVILCLQAAPLGLCLFLFFPRFEPLWSLDIKKEEPTVGLSDSMSPADIAELGAAQGVAFRVKFDGAIPLPEDLYWRALTLTTFDGVEWKSLFSNMQSQISFSGTEFQKKLKVQTKPEDEQFTYQLSLEPTKQHWLPTLDRPISLSIPSSVMPDFSIYVEKPVNTVMGYSGESVPNGALNPLLNDWVKNKNLELPLGFNPKTIQYAQDTLIQLGHDKDQFINHVLHLFRDQKFYYTLQPGRYGKNSVDEFLFERREGFCAHYATAMAALLRSVHIPARIVVGYHGGEINPIGGHLVIHQYDAHAWVEAWRAGVGWVRYDPTAMVAPWRLIVGVEEMVRQNATNGVPILQDSFLRSNEFTNKIRLFLDYSNYRWNTYVVHFDSASQRKIVEQLFDTYSIRKMLFMMIVSLMSAVGCIAFILFWKARARFSCASERTLIKLLNRLEKKYHPRPIGMTLQTYALQLKKHMSDNDYNSLQKVIDLYSQLAYQSLSEIDKKTTLLHFMKEAKSATNRA